MDSSSEVKVDANITPEAEDPQVLERQQQDEEPTIKEFMVMTQLHLQEEKNDRLSNCCNFETRKQREHQWLVWGQ